MTRSFFGTSGLREDDIDYFTNTLLEADRYTIMRYYLLYIMYEPGEAAEGRTTHCKGWNGVNGMALMDLILIHLFCSSHYQEAVLPNGGATTLWYEAL